jgi:hypothetical protein
VEPISPSTLATGGLIAVLVAGWQQVKTFFSYISSFIIVDVILDVGLSHPFRTYIQSHWKCLPSGHLVYLVRWMASKNKSWDLIVPFKMVANRSVWYHRGKVIIVLFKQQRVQILTLQGMVNFDKMISDVLDYWEQTVQIPQNEAASNTRFQIIKKIGKEKGTWSLGRGREEVATKGSDSSLATPSSGDAIDYCFDSSIDRSFKYPPEAYMWVREDDPFETLYFPPEVMRYIEQAKRWKNMGKWYVERKIPWRRGWLLHGPAGTGKSSLAKATAQYLDIPLYHWYLATLSDQEFIEEWANMMTPCVVLFEDFDTVFNKREPLTEHKSLTFDCVLNQISGINSSKGIFLIVTTNNIEKIDEAMGVSWNSDGISTRPGRIDSVIKLDRMTEENRRRLAVQILRDWPNEISDMVEKGEGATPIQFQEMCIQLAFDKLSKEQKHA